MPFGICDEKLLCIMLTQLNTYLIAPSVVTVYSKMQIVLHRRSGASKVNSPTSPWRHYFIGQPNCRPHHHRLIQTHGYLAVPCRPWQRCVSDSLCPLSRRRIHRQSTQQMVSVHASQSLTILTTRTPLFVGALSSPTQYVVASRRKRCGAFIGTF